MITRKQLNRRTFLRGIGTAVHYPNAEINVLDTNHPDRNFVSVQSVVIDARDRLWVLDTGSLKMERVLRGGAKLVEINLSSNRVAKSIDFPVDVVLPTSYINDVRFDLRKGTEGVVTTCGIGNPQPSLQS